MFELCADEVAAGGFDAVDGVIFSLFSSQFCRDGKEERCAFKVDTKHKIIYSMYRSTRNLTSSSKVRAKCYRHIDRT